MSSKKFGLSAVGLSAVAAAVSLALPSAVAQSPVMLTPKQASLAGVSIAPESAPDYEVASLIVKLRAPTADLAHAKAATNMRALSAGAGIRMKSAVAMSEGASVVELESPMSLSAAKAVAARLAADPAVEYAEPDIVFKPSALPIENPEFAAKQWNWAGPLDMYTGAVQVAAPPDVPPLTSIATGGINMAAAWDLPVGTNEVVVAIIDTGITNHPDLNGVTAPVATQFQLTPRFLAGYDFVSANALGLAAPGRQLCNDGLVGRDSESDRSGDAVDSQHKEQTLCAMKTRNFLPRITITSPLRIRGRHAHGGNHRCNRGQHHWHGGYRIQGEHQDSSGASARSMRRSIKRYCGRDYLGVRRDSGNVTPMRSHSSKGDQCRRRLRAGHSMSEFAKRCDYSGDWTGGSRCCTHRQQLRA